MSRRTKKLYGHLRHYRSYFYAHGMGMTPEHLQYQDIPRQSRGGLKQKSGQIPPIIDTIEGFTTTTSLLTIKVGNSMRMFTETFAKGDYYLCAAAGLPALTLSIIINMVN